MTTGHRKPHLPPGRRAKRPAISWGDDAPAERRQAAPVKRSGLPRARNWRKAALLGLPVLFFVLAGMGLFLAYGPIPDPEPEKVPVAPDPLAGLAPDVRNSLVEQEVQIQAQLKLTFLGSPAQLCEELAEIGLPNNGWRKAPFVGARWQCASDVVPLTTPSVDFGPTTLFFILRGPSEERIDYLRLKLNVEDPRQKDYGQETVRTVIQALSDRYSWAVPDRFLQAIADFEPLEMTDRGVRLSVAPEDPELTGDPGASGRLNIVLNFGEPDLIRPAERFKK
jgi:hypothetical protein